MGDVIVHDSQLRSAWRPEIGGYDFTGSFALVRDSLMAPDLTIANLETTLPGDFGLYGGYPRFGAPDAWHGP